MKSKDLYKEAVKIGGKGQMTRADAERENKNADLTGKEADIVKHIKDVNGMKKHYSYSLSFDQVCFIRNLNDGDPFGACCDAYNLGFYNGMRYQRNKGKKKAM